MHKKTIFITIYDGDTDKNILRSGVFEKIKSSGHRIILFIRGKDRLEYYKKEFEKDNVFVELLPFAFSFYEKLWYHLGWNTLPTQAVFLRRRGFYIKHRNPIRYFLEYAAGILGKLRLWRFFLRFVYLIIPDNYAEEFFDKYKPDLLFAPNMFSPEDLRMLKQSKIWKVKTITTAKSWDVLITKAFTRVIADKILVFNEFNKEEAVNVGDYSPSKVLITGFPQFDVYNSPSIILPREEFFRRVGGDPNKDMILIAAPGDWKTTHNREIVLEINRRIERGYFAKPLQILVRFHPKYRDSAEGLVLKNIITERPGTHFSNEGEFNIDSGASNIYQWTFTNKDVVHLANSIYHSSVVVNTESTITLDGLACDKPVILVGYDGDVDLPYWESVRKLYDREHFARIVQTQAVPLAKSHDDLCNFINEFVKNPDHLLDKRINLKNKMLYKIDGRAAERVAGSVLSMF